MQHSTLLLLFLFGLLASLGPVCSAQNGGIEITPIFEGVAWDAEKEHVVRQALADAVRKSLGSITSDLLTDPATPFLGTPCQCGF